MRILQLHADFIEYKPLAKEIELAEEWEGDEVRVEDLVVAFVSIEEEDKEDTVKLAIDDMVDSLGRLGTKRLLIYPYSHLSHRLAKPDKALQLLMKMEELAREKGLEVHRSPFGWNKSFTIRVKGHPLAEQSKFYEGSRPSTNREVKEEVSKALQAEEELLSHWFIMDAEGRLIEPSAFDFSHHPTLEKLVRYEMSKVRASPQSPPHVGLMKRLGIADHEPGSDPGNMRYYPKGRLIKALLEQYVSEMVRGYGGVEVETPIMYDATHPSLAQYLHRFPARQYLVRSEDRELFLRFSACFGQFLLAKDAQLSYKQLPLRLYELTRYSFRREKSGELAGLRRLRAFTMPDCHALCADLEQAKEEFVRRFQLSMETLRGIGLEPGDYELAIRFTKQFYEENKDFIVLLLRLWNRPALVEMWEERFFYFVLKWEFNFIDNLEKASALSTDQIDVENGMRFGITFVDERGEERHPLILHNSPSGAIERCIYALLEKAHRIQQQGGIPMLPLWLSPTQVRLIPVAEEHIPKCEEMLEHLEVHQIRADIDDRMETVAKRVREAEREWIPYIIVVGEKEEIDGKLPVRVRSASSIVEWKLEELVEEIKREVRGKPFLPLPLPKHLSRRPLFSPS